MEKEKENLAVQKPSLPQGGRFQVNAPPHGQFDHDAAPQPRGDAVIPERRVALQWQTMQHSSVQRVNLSPSINYIST